MPNDSGGSDDPPAPGASQATTVNSPQSPSSCRRHVAGPSPTYPCRRTSGGPLPARSYAMRNPPTFIVSMTPPVADSNGHFHADLWTMAPCPAHTPLGGDLTRFEGEAEANDLM